jgi:hypothetical protein
MELTHAYSTNKRADSRLSSPLRQEERRRHVSPEAKTRIAARGSASHRLIKINGAAGSDSGRPVNLLLRERRSMFTDLPNPRAFASRTVNRHILPPCLPVDNSKGFSWSAAIDRAISQHSLALRHVTIGIASRLYSK